MPSRKFSPVSAPAPRTIILGGTFTIGSSGAISAQTAEGLSGAVVAQTGSEDGRYSVTFTNPVARNLGAHVQIVGPTDAAFPTDTGSDPQTRNLATTGFDFQAKRTDTQADADSASGTICSWFCIVAMS